jgi:hypothetical protein
MLAVFASQNGGHGKHLMVVVQNGPDNTDNRAADTIRAFEVEDFPTCIFGPAGNLFEIEMTKAL